MEPDFRSQEKAIPDRLVPGAVRAAMEPDFRSQEKTSGSRVSDVQK